MSEERLVDIDRAIEILNERRHNGVSDWRIAEAPAMALFRGDFAVSPSLPMRISMLATFDAVAVAEKYERGDTNYWQPQ